MLKSIRVSQKAREVFFRKSQIRLGRVSARDIPSLDVETRWSSTFSMIESCFKLRDVFVAMPNSDEVSHLLDLSNLCELACRHLYGISRFLQPAAEVVELSSSSTNVTTSIQISTLL